MTNFRILIVGLIFFCSSSYYVNAQDLEDFGYNTIPATGERPLLTILLEFSDAKFDPKRTVEYYQEILFGEQRPNIAGAGGFFHQNSNGRFKFKNVGIIGPFLNIDDPDTAVDESSWVCAMDLQEGCDNVQGTGYRHLGNAIKLAQENGFDFSAFDTNRDQLITNDELVVYVFEAAKGWEDNFATTNPAWTDKPEDVNSQYQFVRLEGYVFTPDAVQPPQTTSLKSWRSPSRTDNFITTDPSWNGKAGDKKLPDYEFVRNEGYVFSPDQAARFGTIPLYSWWSPSRLDNFMTSNPQWAGKPGDIINAPDYKFVRLEGYIFSPDLPQPPNTVPLFSWWADGEAYDAGGGGNRSTLPNAIKLGETTINLLVARTGEAANAATIAHELGHTIGQFWEAYGANCNNLGYTIMSCSPGEKDAFNLHHFDPFAKIKFGWAKPEIITVQESKELALWATELSPPDKNKLYLIYDPDRGTNEFFLLEHRITNGISPQSGQVPINSWWSSAREDNFATTAFPWRGNIGDRKAPDYVNYRTEGFAFFPLNPPPSGTIPLYSWWSPSRGDNFITSNPEWSGSAGDVMPPDYRFVRREGYIYSPDLPQPSNTVALYSWWSASRGDNFITSNPEWDPDKAGNTRSPDYKFFRHEGYVNNAPVFNYDGDPLGQGYQTLPDEGLAIWHVLIDFENTAPREIPAQDFPIPTDKVELSTWWSKERGDHFTTTKKNWSWKTNGKKNPDYAFLRVEAYIDPPSQLTPPNKVPLYSWWSPSRGDNFITTNPEWAGERGDRKPPDYQFVGLEGYVHSPNLPQPENTRKLCSWWNRNRQDNFLTAHPHWEGEVGKEQDGYRLFRIEGYVENFVDRRDASLYLIPPNLKKGQPNGPNGLWSKSDGVGRLNWHDGERAFNIEVLSEDNKGPVIKVKLKSP